MMPAAGMFLTCHVDDGISALSTSSRLGLAAGGSEVRSSLHETASSDAPILFLGVWATQHGHLPAFRAHLHRTLALLSDRSAR